MAARAFLLAALMFAVPARAQGNYRSAALGGRSALMGDTGVALGTDSAAAFLNPALIAAQGQPRLSLSINLVGYVVHLSNWYAPAPVDTNIYGNVPTGDTSITRVSGNAIPSTVCLFQPIKRIGAASEDEGNAGRQNFAACFGTTELDQFDWVGKGYQATGLDRSTIQTSSVRWAWQRFVLAPTYAVQVTEALSFGASIQGGVTNYSAFRGVGAMTSGGTLLPSSNAFQSGASGSDLTLTGLIGALFSYRRWSIGATVQSPDLSVYGHGNVNSNVQLAGSSISTMYLGEGEFHAREPARFAVGVGYQWPMGSIEIDAQLALADGNALELDSHGTEAVGTATNTNASRLLTTRYQPTFNGGIGAQFFLSRSFSVLGGFGTDMSAVDSLTPTSVAASQINRLFASFGVGTHGDNGALLIGVQGYYGFGHALAPNIYAAEPTLVPTPTQTYGALVVIAGSTNAKVIAGAVKAITR